MGSTSGIIAYHLDIISGVEYGASQDTKPLPRDGLTDMRSGTIDLAGRIPPRFLTQAIKTKRAGGDRP